MSQPLLFDANVLIDYAAADQQLLRLIARHLAPIMVPTAVFCEVHGLRESDAASLGLNLVEPTAAQMVAASNPLPGLSFNDKLCFIMCRENGWVCVTNDEKLRRTCRDYRIPTIRGLRPLIELVRGGQLKAQRAVKTVKAMHYENPFHISTDVVRAFCAEIGVDWRTV